MNRESVPISHDKEFRRKIRDSGCKEDVLPLSRLRELRVLWQTRLDNNEYPEDTCKNMIRLYDIRIMRLGG